MTIIPQRYEEAVDITTLTEHPDNPRKGDEESINDSMAAHGFYGAVYAQESTRRIIAGNHRTRVARRRGELTVPVVWLDVDDVEALELMLVDNRTNDKASYDNPVLVSLLSQLQETERGLIGTGYDTEDLKLLASLPDYEPGMNGDGRPQLGDVAYRIVVECEDEAQQAELIEAFTDQGLSVRAVIN